MHCVLVFNKRVIRRQKEGWWRNQSLWDSQSFECSRRRENWSLWVSHSWRSSNQEHHANKSTVSSDSQGTHVYLQLPSAKHKCKPHCPTGSVVHELCVGRRTVMFVWRQTEVHSLISVSPQTSWSLIVLQCQSQVQDRLWWPRRDISFTSP